MNNADITDPVFREAVDAIDSGDLAGLRVLLDAHPRLVRQPLVREQPGQKRPYLIWFIADNPIRNPSLPGNIVEITRMLVAAIRDAAPETLASQLDDTLGLVATGRIPKECGVQIALMDLLIDSGAKPGGALAAIAHGNPEAAAHLVRRGAEPIRRGAELTFPLAVGLGWKEDVARLAPTAAREEWDLALIVAAFRGDAEMIWYLLRGGASVKGIPTDCHGFHGHATALHQAVSSASLDSVKLLVEAGSDLGEKDRIYQGTPLDWADYLQREEPDEERKKKFKAIEGYLREAQAAAD